MMASNTLVPVCTANLDISTYAIYCCKHYGVAVEDAPVTKKEIVRTISDDIGLTQLKTKEIVQRTFDAIIETLAEDRRIELRNFGVFEVKERAARKARNPRTGDKVSVPAKFVVTFKPGKEMEERVRQLAMKAAARVEGKAENGSVAGLRLVGDPEDLGGSDGT